LNYISILLIIVNKEQKVYENNWIGGIVHITLINIKGKASYQKN